MNEQDPRIPPTSQSERAFSLIALGTILLRYRRRIILCGAVGGLIGLSIGLLTTRQYKTTTIFIPEGADEAASGLALAASQFGIRLPANDATWGPAVYVELVRSRTLLQDLLVDTLTVLEEGGRRAVLLDLLRIRGKSPARRMELGVDALKKIVRASEDKRLGAVRLSITTKWPSVSLAIASWLVTRVDRFNVETRRSQATAERQFVEAQVQEAQRTLRESEDHLQTFLQRNRLLGNSPELAFQKERLQRDVELRRQVYTALVQKRDEARIREVRDTPVITVLEQPQLPARGEKRGTVQKALLGGFLGGLIALVTGLASRRLATVGSSGDEEAREFLSLVGEVTPPFLRRRTSAQ